ncbi:hypothetical protein [Blattabacterium cuenoti]
MIENKKIKLIGITGKMGSGKSLFSFFLKKKEFLSILQIKEEKY